MDKRLFGIDVPVKITSPETYRLLSVEIKSSSLTIPNSIDLNISSNITWSCYPANNCFLLYSHSSLIDSLIELELDSVSDKFAESC